MSPWCTTWRTPFSSDRPADALQVAAVSLTNPIFILLMAFANMFGMGGSAMISVALGENNHQSVKKISSFISWASLVVGAAFAAVLLCFTAPILHLFGADASTFEFARGYTVYIAFGAPASSSGRRQPASLCARKARARRP